MFDKSSFPVCFENICEFQWNYITWETNKIHILHKWNASKGKVVGSEEWSVDVWGH